MITKRKKKNEEERERKKDKGKEGVTERMNHQVEGGGVVIAIAKRRSPLNSEHVRARRCSL